MHKVRFTEHRFFGGITRTLNEVREITECWLYEYNSQRPHESLNNQTPEEFVRSLQKGPDL